MNDSVNILNDSVSQQTIAAIARHVAALRKRQGLSLDQLAARARVSKGSLAGLEKAAGNPSISLLCQTAAALGVSVSDLLAASTPRKAEVFRLGGGEVLWRGKTGGTARLLFGTRGPLMFELWEWLILPAERYQAKAHSPGTKEILYTMKGRLGAVIDGEVFEIGPGQGLSMETDVPHAYYCAGKQPVRFRMIVVERPIDVAS
ncbi:MAG: helix-turn-helix domain-containing protein [Acidobacteria bacterium]|nr:helix-turn-helix domain-containing protein [Acidobacteriota bacterium]